MKSITIDLAAGSPAGAPLLEIGAITIGVFDGLHAGHHRLVETLVREGSPSGSALVTFTDHPRAVLAGHAPVRILHPRLRNRLLASWGVGVVVQLATTRALLALSPEDFLDRLFAAVRARRIVVGPNFHFGRARAGTIETLRSRGREEVVVVEPTLSGETAGKGAPLASATLIRNLLCVADLAGAARLLERDYAVLAIPRSGDAIGRTIGSPTLNLYPVPEALPDGVYAVRSPFGPAVCHIGPRPTLGSKERRFEVHVLEGAPSPGDSDEIEIAFVEKLRDVKTFADVEELKRAIASDVEKAKRILG